MLLTKPYFDENELKHLEKCLNSGWVTQGPAAKEFENRLAKIQGVNRAIATTSCTAGLHLSMLATDIKPGSEVIVPAFTWITSANCAEYINAKAVFVDVEPETFNIDPEKIEAAITENTKAIVAVHLFGLAANMDAINKIAKKHNLWVIEDAACAVGTEYKGKPVGGLGDFGCFSFHPRKLITTGEGGLVTTNSEELAEKVSSLRNHGATGELVRIGQEETGPWTMGGFENLGYNLRLSDILASVGLAQLDKFPAILESRRTQAVYYSEKLSGVEEINLPTQTNFEGHNFQAYVIRVNGDRNFRNHVMSCFESKNIQTRPGTHAVHRLGYYKKKYNINETDFPVAAQCEDTSITLPLFHGMSSKQQDQVVDILTASLVNK